jgi:glucosamine--fructose-6-phosphate aminotransferase (isomerizing)
MNFDDIDLKWQNMLAGIKAQVPFVRDSPAAIYEDIKSKLNLKNGPSKIYLIGCGDSWYCGMATRLAFEDWSGIPTEALQSLEFSRYYVNYAPKDSMVITISNSGRVSRTIEAVKKARARGLVTVAGTSNLKDGISQVADHTIDLAYSERRFAPGTSSYMASMVVQYCLAVYLAELNGCLNSDQVKEKLAEISAVADSMQQTIDTAMPVLERLASTAELNDQVVFIGGGPNYGTAFFSMAKMIEATRTSAVGQELEEWAHEQYFTTNNRTITFVLAPSGASVDRAREQMYAIREMGSTCVAVCHPDDKETQALADIIVPIFGNDHEVLSPLSYCIPGELYAFFLGILNNVAMLGFDNPHIKEVNFRQIFGSQIQD